MSLMRRLSFADKKVVQRRRHGGRAARGAREKPHRQSMSNVLSFLTESSAHRVLTPRSVRLQEEKEREEETRSLKGDRKREQPSKKESQSKPPPPKRGKLTFALPCSPVTCAAANNVKCTDCLYFSIWIFTKFCFHFDALIFQ